MFETLITALHVLVAVALIVIVLFQHGSKGASMGSAFGGSSQTLFGSRGPATALAKITTAAAVVFMLTSITLSVVSSRLSEESVVLEGPDTGSVTLPVDLPGAEPGQGAAPGGPVSPIEAPAESAPAQPVEPIGPVDPMKPESGPGN